MTEPIYTISSIHCKKGITEKGECLLIGVVLNDQFIGWSKCVGLFDNAAIIYTVEAAMKTVQEIVMPALHKRPFSTLQSLSAQLDTLTETITVVESLPVEQPSATVSRRNILAGNFKTNVKPVEPNIKKTEAKRPLPAPLRFGISHAYLTAVSNLHNQSIAQTVAEMYGLSIEKTSIPIHILVNDGNMTAAQPILAKHVTSLGYETGNDIEVLGSNGRHLQRLVRQVSAWISTLAPEYQATIHLNLEGALSKMFENDAGKMLGSLYGLERAAKPYDVCIENPLTLSDETIPNLQKLKSFLPVRKMTLTLMTGLSSLLDMQKIVEADAVHGVHLRLSQLGDLHQTIAFILDCKERDLSVMISGGEGGFAETAVQIAIATGADLVAGSPTQLFNKMQQIFKSPTIPIL